jgi:hypothetical protein
MAAKAGEQNRAQVCKKIIILIIRDERLESLNLFLLLGNLFSRRQVLTALCSITDMYYSEDEHQVHFRLRNLDTGEPLRLWCVLAYRFFLIDCFSSCSFLPLGNCYFFNECFVQSRKVLKPRYACESEGHYRLVHYDLEQAARWKVSYLSDTRQIVHMQARSVKRCGVQWGIVRVVRTDAIFFSWCNSDWFESTKKWENSFWTRTTIRFLGVIAVVVAKLLVGSRDGLH